MMFFRVTPVPIPNTTVKPLEADGTARETVWESRWSPGLYDSLAQSVEHMTFNHGVQGSIPWQSPKTSLIREVFFVYKNILYKLV